MRKSNTDLKQWQVAAWLCKQWSIRNGRQTIRKSVSFSFILIAPIMGCCWEFRWGIRLSVRAQVLMDCTGAGGGESLDDISKKSSGGFSKVSRVCKRWWEWGWFWSIFWCLKVVCLRITQERHGHSVKGPRESFSKKRGQQLVHRSRFRREQ